MWFVQDAIAKTADVTVVYVDGQCFAFELDATPGPIDWRQRLAEPQALQWRRALLSDDREDAIGNFMSDCRLRFGRLDFARTADQLYFLEVNPNGQWAWLDPDDRHGLLTAVLQAIAPFGAGAAAS